MIKSFVKIFAGLSFARDRSDFQLLRLGLLTEVMVPVFYVPAATSEFRYLAQVVSLSMNRVGIVRNSPILSGTVVSTLHP